MWERKIKEMGESKRVRFNINTRKDCDNMGSAGAH
jgi:hypothetical protein